MACCLDMTGHDKTCLVMNGLGFFAKIIVPLWCLPVFGHFLAAKWLKRRLACRLGLKILFQDVLDPGMALLIELRCVVARNMVSLCLFCVAMLLRFVIFFFFPYVFLVFVVVGQRHSINTLRKENVA